MLWSVISFRKSFFTWPKKGTGARSDGITRCSSMQLAAFIFYYYFKICIIVIGVLCTGAPVDCCILSLVVAVAQSWDGLWLNFCHLHSLKATTKLFGWDQWVLFLSVWVFIVFYFIMSRGCTPGSFISTTWWGGGGGGFFHIISEVASFHTSAKLMICSFSWHCNFESMFLTFMMFISLYIMCLFLNFNILVLHSVFNFFYLLMIFEGTITRILVSFNWRQLVMHYACCCFLLPDLLYYLPVISTNNVDDHFLSLIHSNIWHS